MNNKRISKFLIDNIVTIIFVVLSVLGLIVSKQPAFFILSELVQRVSRNTFLVMALIIPVMAGLGLNFSIVIGAMAGQMAIIMVTDWGFGGMTGILLALLISIPIAYLFGKLIGILLNKTRGQEMIASMIVGFFANGIYQFIYLFLVGRVIPMRKKIMLISGGKGLRNTVNLAGKDGIKYAFDKLEIFGIKTAIPFFWAMAIIAGIYLLFKLYKHFRPTIYFDRVVSKKRELVKNVVIGVLFIASIYLALNKSLPISIKMIGKIPIPMFTMLIIALGGIFNVWFPTTKLGQDFRTVGQDQHIAEVSGINVDKRRIQAMTLSTIFAAFGQIILLQNLGVLNTYGSHMQVGLYSIAAILVGGASVRKATVKQVVLGVILFHTLFLVSSPAGKELFGDPMIGEYFRVFVTYSVISLSLGLYGWKKAKADQERRMKL